ncbi:MAG: response regulator [Alphaproteobacteria bacterium]|nr:response regulator [Alphaproteobacteria bacterium]NCQ66895.1 response regulator [Alphaproteobacteria bacterium]NCT07463.1 response regulator [Alphaproteobacteria bacterium]
MDFKAGNEREQTKRDSFETPPLFYAFIVLGLSLVPFVLNLSGVDFASTYKDFSLNANQNDIASLPNAMISYNFTGTLTHTILEWSAFCTAIFTVILAFIHYGVTKDVAIPMIAMALLCAGAIDVSHIFALDKSVEFVAGKESFMPFLWTACRLFNAGIIIAGISVTAAYSKKKLNQNGLGFLVLAGISFGAIAYGIIQGGASSERLIRAQLSPGIMASFYDILPLIVFILGGVFVYYPFYKRNRSLFSYALLLSLIPVIATEAHMVFGSLKSFDNHFNSAHFLKIFGYFLPFMGLCCDYILRDKKSKGVYRELEVTNKKLDSALSQVQIVTQSKSNFLASMTHELRTPVNNILGVSDFLSDSQLEFAQKQQVNIIKGCANSLLIMINDIFDFSKLEAGKMSVESRPFNVKKMCKETLELVRFQAEGKGLKLEFECHETVPDYVKADANCLRQILLNFLSNAIKFTVKGHVKLILSSSEQASGDYKRSTFIRFTVEDTGIGVPENIADYLLEPFTQADSNMSRKFGGTGLGLAISRKLADLTGGEIRLKNLEEGGSRFCFETPVDRVSQSTVEEPEQKAPERRGLQILIAEDNRVNEAVILSVLKKIGYEADVVHNGLEVLEALDRRPYDLIFMDVMMPEMDGIQATAEIRQRFGEARDGVRKPRIIAVTACATAEDRDRCLKAGMDDFIGKPVTFSELKEKISAIPQVIFDRPLENDSSVVEPTVIKSVVSFKGTRFESRKVLRSFEGDEEMIPDMIDLFLKTSLEYMGQIKKAIEAKNAAELQLHSHTLKGSAQIFYADRAVEISQALENLGQNKSFEKAQILYKELEKELPLLQQELESFKKKLA